MYLRREEKLIYMFAFYNKVLFWLNQFNSVWFNWFHTFETKNELD
jgi:hypothetical protein